MARGSRKPARNRPASTEGRRKQRIGLRRLLGLAVFLPLASRAPLYGRLIWELVRDDRTPAGRKAILAGALGYLVLGRDLVPDDLPVIGGLDDLVVVVLAVDVFLDGVPGGRPGREARRARHRPAGVPRRRGANPALHAGRVEAHHSPGAGACWRSPARRCIPAGSGRRSGPGSTTRRVRTREGDPDEGRREARQDAAR